MPELNSDCPEFECLIRKEYLYNLESGDGEFVPASVFGVSSIFGRAIGFHAMTDAGAVIWRLPISALVHRGDAPKIPLDHLELWDCFSANVSVTVFDALKGRRCMTILKDKKRYEGRYCFTLDWWGNCYAENAGESGHKCAHILQLDCGVYAAQPNNRVLFADPATIPRPFETIPDYVTNEHIWSCENKTKWATEDSDAMFYEVNDAQPAE